MACIIYAERLRNFRWDDAILDEVLAQSGYNSSVGFSQIKINTAFWIEEQLNDPHSAYYFGNNYRSILPRSRSREEIIRRLLIDSVNIRYCALYAAMIRKRWVDTGFIFTGENECGLLATLYSLGVVRDNGDERLPGPHPRMNEFGKTAQQFFESLPFRGQILSGM